MRRLQAALHGGLHARLHALATAWAHRLAGGRGPCTVITGLHALSAPAAHDLLAQAFASLGTGKAAPKGGPALVPKSDSALVPAGGPALLVLADYCLAERNLYLPAVAVAQGLEWLGGEHAAACRAFMAAGGLEGLVFREMAGREVTGREMAGREWPGREVVGRERAGREWPAFEQARREPGRERPAQQGRIVRATVLGGAVRLLGLYGESGLSLSRSEETSPGPGTV